MKIINKKAQEEMVGFVLIIVLVAVIAVVFLGISIRKPSNIVAQQSEAVDSFIKSVAVYTTDCEDPASYYQSIENLILDCYNGRRCSDEREACNVLQLDLANILNSSYIVTNGSYVRGYEMKIESGQNTSRVSIGTFNTIKVGNLNQCPGSKLFNERSFSTGISDERIVMRFEICYNALKAG
ncbi:MAG: hypothetical protein WC781_04235 [Candidatus Pacearchaeota archaeon]|jgi:hypothetical protein